MRESQWQICAPCIRDSALEKCGNQRRGDPPVYPEPVLGLSKGPPPPFALSLSKGLS